MMRSYDYYEEGLRICEIRDKLSIEGSTIAAWLREFAEEKTIISIPMSK